MVVDAEIIRRSDPGLAIQVEERAGRTETVSIELDRSAGVTDERCVIESVCRCQALAEIVVVELEQVDRSDA